MSVAPARHPEVRLIGRSEAIRTLEAESECAARSDAKVLITGETGVGKEVVARLIHQRSARASAPLVTLNCAGLPDSLLESELFGHVRGSFTGAYRDKPGLLEMAPNGTVFLDEVGEMSTRMQVVLLRFLESGEIQRIGADRSHTRVNVRLITATNSRPAGADRLGRVPRRPLLPAERHPADHSAAARARGRHPAARQLLPELLQPASTRSTASEITLGRDGRADGVSLARQHPRAQERRRARGPEDRRARRFGTATCRPTSCARVGGRRPRTRVNGHGDAAQRNTRADELATLMLEHGESFWSAVYPDFHVARPDAHATCARSSRSASRRTNGNYRLLVQLFNMPTEDYKRFLSFLRKHDCHLPFQRFRAAPARLHGPQPVRPLAKAT